MHTRATHPFYDIYEISYVGAPTTTTTKKKQSSLEISPLYKYCDNLALPIYLIPTSVLYFDEPDLVSYNSSGKGCGCRNCMLSNEYG